MTAILVRPLPFTVGTNTGWLATNPVSYTNLDHYGLVAQSSGNTASFTVNLGSSQTIDTVALIGSNLPSTATITVVAGAYNSGATAAFTGVKDAATTTKSIFQFTAVATATVTVTITSSAPIQFQRLVIGKQVVTDGVDQNIEQEFTDQSVVESLPGIDLIESWPTLMGWKVKMSWISDIKWRTEFVPLFNRVGSSRPILFVPVANDSTRFQHEAVFGRMKGIAKGEHNSSDNWVVSFGITALAP